MWFDWVQARTLRYRVYENQTVLFEGEHAGFSQRRNRIYHCRSILLWDDFWLIVDDLLGEGNHRSSLFWHLATAPCSFYKGKLCWDTGTLKACLVAMAEDRSEQSTIISANETLPAGWQSLYYGKKQPAPSLHIEGQWNLPVRLFTFVSVGSDLEVLHLRRDQVICRRGADQCLTVKLYEPRATPCNVFRSAERDSEVMEFN